MPKKKVEPQDDDYTTLSLKFKTKKNLLSVGRMGQTADELINELILLKKGVR